MNLVLDHNLVLAAGAGSGKTHALVTVALGIYGGAGGRAPIDPARVWAVTFTEKAAAELRQRLADRALRLAHRGGDLSDEPDLARMFGERRPSRGDWERIARALSTAPIGTFHSLCAQLLRTFAAEARLDPRFAILDERAAARLFERAREEILLELLGEEGAARRLVAELGGLDPLRAALDMLHARLAEEGRDPRSLVATFDETAARAHLGDACGSLARWLPIVETLDHARLARAVEALRRERGRIGACAVEAIESWYPAVAAIFEVRPGNLPREIKERWNAAKGAWEAVQQSWAALRQAAIAADLVEVLEQVESAYRAEKERAGGLDFSDLVRRARDLLRDDRDVRREAKRRISALLVDEFQDTNGVQLDLVRLLAEARDEERVVPPGGSCADLPLAPAVLCAVGDRKQSIYEFRGADVALFAALTAKARAGDGLRLHALKHSYRSRPDLVRFANGLFATLLAPRERPYEVGWFEEEDPLEPRRTDSETYAGRPSVQLLVGEVGLSADERKKFEARLVADHVAALLASGMRIEEKGGAVRPLVGSDVALLFRTMEAAPLYQRALEARGIPTLVVGGRGFFSAREVRDLGALLLAICDPRDRFASAAVLRSPIGGISDAALVRLAAADALELSRHGEGCAAELGEGEAERVARLGRLVRRLSREVDRLGPAGVLRLAIDALELRPIWAAAPRGEQRLANVEKLLGWLEERRGLGALAAAEEILARAEDSGDRESPADVAAFADARAVRVLTVHASKGLEFPVVVVPELGAGARSIHEAVLFERELGLAVKPMDPLGDRIRDEHVDAVLDALGARQEAESRRLFYVAVTRARDLLVLCGESSKRSQGTWRQLLDEALPAVDHLVERVQVATGPAVADDAPRSEPPRDARADETIAAEARRLLERVAPIRCEAGRFVAAVTELAELQRCERRYFYKIVAGLEEHPGGGPLVEIVEADEADLPGLDRLARGQLAHRILEVVDYARVRTDADAAVREIVLAEGLDPEHPEVAQIAADARAFLEGPMGTTLAAIPPERIFRELPFALELQAQRGSRLVLRGQIDLLFVGDDGAVHLVDYKHASGKGQDPDAYGFQLRTYALAASRILPGESPMRIGIAWLRDRGAAPSLRPIDRGALEQHEARLIALGDALGRARASDEWRKLDAPSHCGDCGFFRRCWGARG